MHSPSLPRPYTASSPPRNASGWTCLASASGHRASLQTPRQLPSPSRQRHRLVDPPPNTPLVVGGSVLVPVPYRQCTASQPRPSRSFLSSSPCCRNRSSSSTSPMRSCTFASNPRISYLGTVAQRTPENAPTLACRCSVSPTCVSSASSPLPPMSAPAPSPHLRQRTVRRGQSRVSASVPRDHLSLI